MDDNNLENVRIMVQSNQYSVSQLGIDLIQQSNDDDPIIEAVVVSRRKSGLIETETSLLHMDTMAKMAEHLHVRSTFDSALENAHISYEEYAEREDTDEDGDE